MTSSLLDPAIGFAPPNGCTTELLTRTVAAISSASLRKGGL